MQESGLTEVIPLTCTSPIWGQQPSWASSDSQAHHSWWQLSLMTVTSLFTDLKGNTPFLRPVHRVQTQEIWEIKIWPAAWAEGNFLGRRVCPCVPRAQSLVLWGTENAWPLREAHSQALNCTLLIWKWAKSASPRNLSMSFFFPSYIRSKWKTTFKLEGGRIMQMGHHCPVQMFYSIQLFWRNPLDSKKLFPLQKPGRWSQPVRALPSLGQQRMKLTQPFFQNHSIWVQI